ncbi:MAG: nucleoside deaminase [Xanthomonadales bacterium]|nr:nucleoside deaminase [Gammaproteobacteria bacterium]NNE05021.1 nucleoside deaminase [Xanthomonadales bacterium]NNL95596.1 nucleoside deaminase [Xanthomonadales bacterium]
MTSPTEGLNGDDIEHLEAVVEMAIEIARKGASPFTARLVPGNGGSHIDAINTVRESGDVTGHAETNLLRKLAGLSRTDLAASTLYASCEPCAMCAAAICWSHVGRVVYALSHEQMRQLHPTSHREPGVSGTELFQNTKGAPQVVGPVPSVRPDRPFLLDS